MIEYYGVRFNGIKYPEAEYLFLYKKDSGIYYGLGIPKGDLRPNWVEIEIKVIQAANLAYTKLDIDIFHYKFYHVENTRIWQQMYLQNSLLAKQIF